MVYDVELSNDVSLSRILDSMIEDGTSSEIIVQFLKKYDGDFKEIVGRSLFIDRIFNSEYLSKCKRPELEYLFSHLNDIGALNSIYCAWQCLMANSLNSTANFKQFNKLLLKAVNKYSDDVIRHPHAGLAYKEVKELDLDVIKNGFCPELVFDTFSTDELDRFMKGGSHSLFSPRLFQTDCFNACSSAHQFIILKNLMTLPYFVAVKFVRQLLIDEVDPAIKYETIKLGILSHIIDIYGISSLNTQDEIVDMIRKAKCYPEIAINLTLNGEDAITDAIFYMLCTKRYKLLAEMAEMDEETMQHNFPIKDLIDYIKANTHLVEVDSTWKKVGKK